MGLFSKKPVLVVHNGRFHADDIFACATIELLLNKKCTIIRTRDKSVIDSADYVMDVGDIYDPAQRRFDHHQKGGAGFHKNSVPYSSFGLVWKEYGVTVAGSAEVAAHIEQRLVCPIDSEDNGISVSAPVGDIFPYSLQSFLYCFRPTWREDSEMYDTEFPKLVAIAKEVIKREIVQATDYLLAETNVVAAYQSAEDKRVIVLDDRYPFQETLMRYDEPLYVIYPNADKTHWKLECIHAQPVGFVNRKSLPEAWAGLRDEAFSAAVGVPGLVFCHNMRFLAVAKTKEGALALATLALK